MLFKAQFGRKVVQLFQMLVFAENSGRSIPEQHGFVEGCIRSLLLNINPFHVKEMRFFLHFWHSQDYDNKMRKFRDLLAGYISSMQLDIRIAAGHTKWVGRNRLSRLALSDVPKYQKMRETEEAKTLIDSTQRAAEFEVVAA
jgi:hypothetical protein